MSYCHFAEILGFDEVDLGRRALHELSIPVDEEMTHMYNWQYRAPKYGGIVGLDAYYKYLNSMFRVTLTQKVEDKSNILSTSKTLLMAKSG